jgi:hypothetical protein
MTPANVFAVSELYDDLHQSNFWFYGDGSAPKQVSQAMDEPAPGKQPHFAFIPMASTEIREVWAVVRQQHAVLPSQWVFQP